MKMGRYNFFPEKYPGSRRNPGYFHILFFHMPFLELFFKDFLYFQGTDSCIIEVTVFHHSSFSAAPSPSTSLSHRTHR